jgi:hypothetical protein
LQANSKASHTPFSHRNDMPDTICSFREWYYTVYNVTAARQIQSSALFIKVKMKREKRAGNTKGNPNEIELFLNHYCAMFIRKKNPCNKSMLVLLFLNKNMLNIDIIICVYFTDKQKKRAEGEKFVIFFFKKNSECVEHIRTFQVTPIKMQSQVFLIKIY